MDFKKFSIEFAREVDGQYTEYDDSTSLFILKLPKSRFQMVIAKLTANEKYQRKVIRISSKVCPVRDDLNYIDILGSEIDSVYCRFLVEDNFLKTESSFFLDSLTEGHIKEMILEVAQVADHWEKKITGADVN